MKIYISADIEGVAGIAAPGEADPGVPGEYAAFRRQMSEEVQAACRGAYASGANAILVKDAHGPGRNLVMSDFEVPDGKTFELIRGWSGHPFGMVQDIDAGFSGAVFIGFHCAAGQGGNPLAHTINGRLFAGISLNGEVASELRLYALAASMAGVPVLFVSGDSAVCDEAEALIPGVKTVRTMIGSGPSVRSIAPASSLQLIEKGVADAVLTRAAAPLSLPEHFTLKITFRHGADAYARAFYPGARLITDTEVEFASDDYLAVLTFLRFASRYA